jgi:hypothetical protein
MKKRISFVILVLLSVLFIKQTSAQDKKIWASGYARSLFQQNNMQTPNDTMTPVLSNNGYVLVDLAVNAQPNSNTYLHAMIRVRNDLGGFWGSGVTFDLRQMYVKGLIKKAIRYQLGDIDYKLTPYTFFSQSEELSSHQTEVIDIFRDVVHYDLFFNKNNTWRQQGAAVDFSLEFDKGIEEWEFNFFTSRNRTSDFGLQDERFFVGGNTTIRQSKYFEAGLNYIDLMDIKGTSRSNSYFHNPVVTGTSAWQFQTQHLSLGLHTESGISEMYEVNNPNFNKQRDYFYDVSLKIKRMKSNTSFNVGYINVGPQFRSVGAQTKRVNFQSINQFYSRYGNEQLVRAISAMDLMQDVSIFQLNFQPPLNDYSIAYDNINPYGNATPNRAGMMFDAQHIAKDTAFQLFSRLQSLVEVVGMGSNDKRSFTQWHLGGVVNIDKFFKKYHKNIAISFGYTGGQTIRNTSFEEANIDFFQSYLDWGIRLELVSQFDVIASQRFIRAQGNEFKTVRGNSTEVIQFIPEFFSLKEQVLMLALRYHFSPKNTLNLVGQRMFWNQERSGLPSYHLSQFAILYTLQF